jgi:hypothetical protein
MAGISAVGCRPTVSRLGGAAENRTRYENRADLRNAGSNDAELCEPARQRDYARGVDGVKTFKRQMTLRAREGPQPRERSARGNGPYVGPRDLYGG